MRSQMNTPIVWDRETYSYRIDSSQTLGTRYMLPGVWITPEQAYAFLTLNNMVEQMAPSLLGPFLEPMRSMLKEMLCHADLPLYGLNRKIEIQSPNVPALNDIVFATLINALLHDEDLDITYGKAPDSSIETVQCLIKKIRISPEGWRLVLQVSQHEEFEIDADRVIKARRLN